MYIHLCHLSLDQNCFATKNSFLYFFVGLVYGVFTGHVPELKETVQSQQKWIGLPVVESLERTKYIPQVH
jgi:hypothetical protein